MSKQITIGVLFGTLLHENMGCNALNYSFLQCCQFIAQERDITFKYIFFWDIPKSFKDDDLPDELRAYDIEFMKIPDSFLRLFLKGLIKDKMKGWNEFNDAINRCDLFVDSCGGDSFSDIYGNYTLRYISKNHKLAKKKGKKVILLPQTIGPFNTKEGKIRGSEMMNYAHHIFVRDVLSKNAALYYVPESKITQSIDMAFYMEYEQPIVNPKTDSKQCIGLSPSALLWNGGYSGNNQFCLKENYKNLIRRIISKLEEEKFEVVLLAHVLYGSASKPREDDYWLCKRLLKEFPRCKIAPYFYTPMEAKGFISTLDGLLSSRMHCCIGAYSSGVPVFTLGYSRKFNGLFNNTLDYYYGTDLRKDNINSTLDKLEDYLHNLSTIRQEMPSRLQYIESEKTRFIRNLSQMILSCINK